ncbi:MAG TPA: tetratricopeptide repeat protein, partial [Sedimenticola sp.]|nr:tetratricopeptide repeat protein [Sedimenticola sp.]
MNKVVTTLLLSLLLGVFTGCSDSGKNANHVEKASLYLNRGDLKEAAIELKNALQKNPNDLRARWLLGTLYLQTGNPASAEKELRRARELGVVDDSVLPLLARSLLRQKKYAALKALDLSGLTTPENRAQVLAVQGLGLLAQGRLDAAAKKIDAAVAMAPQSVDVLVSQARLLVAREDFDGARQTLDRIFAIVPDYAPAKSLLGDIESLAGNFQASEEAYSQAISEEKKNRFSDILKRARVRIEQKRYAAAQKDVDFLKSKAPQHPLVNFMQGLIHFRQGRTAEAQESFEVAVRGKNPQLMAMYLLAVIH